MWAYIEKWQDDVNLKVLLILAHPITHNPPDPLAGFSRRLVWLKNFGCFLLASVQGVLERGSRFIWLLRPGDRERWLISPDGGASRGFCAFVIDQSGPRFPPFFRLRNEGFCSGHGCWLVHSSRFGRGCQWLGFGRSFKLALWTLADPPAESSMIAEGNQEGSVSCFE